MKLRRWSRYFLLLALLIGVIAVPAAATQAQGGIALTVESQHDQLPVILR